ncbi:MAG: hypothetical protein HQL37_13960 [Alphaproteobacteria bacterium]|nr:hypothetical protein [Alphaproteobacteria bacterium]
MGLPPFDPALLSLSDSDLGLHFWAWWVVAQAESRGIAQDNLTPELAEEIRRQTLATDTNNVEMAAVEKILHLAASGEIERAGKMFRDLMQRFGVAVATLDEVKTGRRKQKAYAKKSRPDALQSIILEIMTRSPGITAEALLNNLRERAEVRDVIESVNDGDEVIEWTDKNGQVKTTPFTAIKDRMSRARKKLKTMRSR